MILGNSLKKKKNYFNIFFQFLHFIWSRFLLEVDSRITNNLLQVRKKPSIQFHKV